MRKIKIKHRCSQTQFRTVVAWCWDAECRSWGRSLEVPLSLVGILVGKTTSEQFLLFAFFCKSENLVWISFSRSFVKAKWCNINFRKVGDTSIKNGNICSQFFTLKCPFKEFDLHIFLHMREVMYIQRILITGMCNIRRLKNFSVHH